MGLFLWLPGVADRQGFPHVPVRLVPVHDAAAVLRVDLHVYWTVWRTSVLDAADPDSCHDAVELGLAHTKAIVLYGEGAIGLVEVEGQSFNNLSQFLWRRSGNHLPNPFDRKGTNLADFHHDFFGRPLARSSSVKGKPARSD